MTWWCPLPSLSICSSVLCISKRKLRLLEYNRIVVVLLFGLFTVLSPMKNRSNILLYIEESLIILSELSSQDVVMPTSLKQIPCNFNRRLVSDQLCSSRSSTLLYWEEMYGRVIRKQLGKWNRIVSKLHVVFISRITITPYMSKNLRYYPNWASWISGLCEHP